MSSAPKLTVNGKFLHDTNPTIEAGGTFLPACRSMAIANTSTHSPGTSTTSPATYTLSTKFLIDGGLPLLLWRHPQPGDRRGETFSQSPDIKAAIGNTLPFQNILGPASRASSSRRGVATNVSDFGPYQDYNVNHTTYGNVTKNSWGRTL